MAPLFFNFYIPKLRITRITCRTDPDSKKNAVKRYKIINVRLWKTIALRISLKILRISTFCWSLWFRIYDKTLDLELFLYDLEQFSQLRIDFFFNDWVDWAGQIRFQFKIKCCLKKPFQLVHNELWKNALNVNLPHLSEFKILNTTTANDYFGIIRHQFFHTKLVAHLIKKILIARFDLTDRKFCEQL